jgi:hypothetical protein
MAVGEGERRWRRRKNGGGGGRRKKARVFSVERRARMEERVI